MSSFFFPPPGSAARNQPSHAKEGMFTGERLGGRLDCLFGEVMLIHINILQSSLNI